MDFGAASVPGFPYPQAMQPAKIHLGAGVQSMAGVPSTAGLQGLSRDDVESLVRAAAELSSASNAASVVNAARSIAMVDNAFMATSGEWVNTVMSTVPFLDQQGIQEALLILDAALANVQHVKSIDSFLLDASLDSQSSIGIASHQAAAKMKAQVQQQQGKLLRQLNVLRVRGIAEAQARSFGTALSPSALLTEQWSNSAWPVAGGMDDTAVLVTALEQLQRRVQQQQQLLQQQQSSLDAATRHPFMQAGSPAAPWHMQHQHAKIQRHEGPQGNSKNVKGSPTPSETQEAGKVPRSQRQMQTLSTSLQLLSKEDPDVLLIVRRINKLGFKAARKLKVHFGQYGTVIRVLVAHSTCRQQSDAAFQAARRRPSSLGFVHMNSKEAVQQVLALGEDQEVDGAIIRVQRFERQHGEAALEEEGFVEDEAEGKASGRAKELSKSDNWLRICSEKSKSTASTAASSSSTQSDS